MEFETHCMSFPCTELLLFNYAKINSIFNSRAPLSQSLRLFLRGTGLFDWDALLTLKTWELSGVS